MSTYKDLMLKWPICDLCPSMYMNLHAKFRDRHYFMKLIQKMKREILWGFI